MFRIQELEISGDEVDEYWTDKIRLEATQGIIRISLCEDCDGFGFGLEKDEYHDFNDHHRHTEKSTNGTIQCNVCEGHGTVRTVTLSMHDVEVVTPYDAKIMSTAQILKDS